MKYLGGAILLLLCFRLPESLPVEKLVPDFRDKRDMIESLVKWCTFYGLHDSKIKELVRKTNKREWDQKQWDADRKAIVESLKVNCKKYKVKPKKMVGIINRETAGTWNKSCYNKHSGAGGLCQITIHAIRGLGLKKDIVQRVYIRDHGWQWKYDSRKIYDIDWNIQAGCMYMADCEKTAGHMWKRLPWQMRLFISEDQVSIMLYCYGYGNVRDMVTTLKYIRGF